MYEINEGQLNIPTEWKDESINVLSAGGGGSQGFSFVINRDELPWGVKFPEYVAQELEKIGDSLEGFQKLDEQPDYSIDNQPAHRLEYRWISKDGPVHQLVVMTAMEQRVLIFTGSMTNQFSAAQKDLLEQIFQSFRFRDEPREDTEATA